MLPILAITLSGGTVMLRVAIWLAGATLLWVGGRFIAKVPRATFWRSLLTYLLAWVAAIAAFVVVMTATWELRRNWPVAEVLRRSVALLASLLVTWFLIKFMFRTSVRKAILAWLPTLAILLIAIPLRMTILLWVFSNLDEVGPPEYIHIARSASGQREFICDYPTSIVDGNEFSKVSERHGTDQQRLSLKGRVQCMAVTDDASLLAVALLPWSDRPDISGKFDLSYPYEVVFIDTKTFQETHRWKVEPSGMPRTYSDGSNAEIEEFDEMAFSRDGKTLATDCIKPTAASKEPRTGITLWEVDSGEDIMELNAPAPDKPLDKPWVLPRILSLGFSADDRLLAVSGSWTDVSDIPNPLLPKVFRRYGFIQIWNITDETEQHFQTKGYSYLWNLCFDETGSRLACWTWSKESKGTSLADVLVWSVPEGDLLLSKQVTGRVLGIVWDVKAKSFAVRLEDQTVVYIEP